MFDSIPVFEIMSWFSSILQRWSMEGFGPFFFFKHHYELIDFKLIWCVSVHVVIILMDASVALSLVYMSLFKLALNVWHNPASLCLFPCMVRCSRFISYIFFFFFILYIFCSRPRIRHFFKEEGHEFFRISVQFYQTAFQKGIIRIYTPISKAWGPLSP